MLYPIIFKPIYKEMIWGGTRLATMFDRNLPSDKVGESWDISCRPSEMGIIENGPLAGTTFEDYIAQDKRGILGTRLENCTRFPLLVKIIDANDVLSIQVHPCDEYAKKQGGHDTGKNEMWYVLSPPHDGNLIIGLKPGVTREKLALAFENGMVEACMEYLPVKTGDIIDIPAGLVHALTPGAMVAEVQQNSDITYRIYDYNRIGLDGKPRPLHVKDALAVADFEEMLLKSVTVGKTIKNGKNELIYAINNPHFTIVKYLLADTIYEESDTQVFSIFTCVEGGATIATDSMSVEVETGRSVFIPASMGKYCITPVGSAVLLKSSI